MKLSVFLLLPLLTLLACSSSTTSQPSTEKPTSPAPAVPTGEWQVLFDGETTQGWHTYLKDDASGWSVVDGALTTGGGKGDLISDATYGNFELELEWKVSPKGNSGIMYLVVEDKQYSSPYLTGPEYQIIDDEGYPADLAPAQITGSNYALNPPKLNATKPAGEWNTTRIKLDNGQVEHWLNGQLVVEYEIWTPEWEAAVAETKFKDMPDYGQARTGHIALQDHSDPVSFRNIRIRAW